MIALRKRRTSPIGLYLGQKTVTLIQLTNPTGPASVQAIAYGALPHTDDLTSEQRDQAIAQTLRTMISDHPFRGKRVISCLGEQELFVQNVRLPQLADEEFDQAIHWEAADRLPYPIDNAEVRHLFAGQVRQDAATKQEVIVMACHHSVIQRHTRMLERAGLSPIAIDVEPCAIMRPFCLDHNDQQEAARVAYLHVGERNAILIFAEGNTILFMKYIAVGGNNFNQAVAQELDLDIDEAIRIRTEFQSASGHDDELQTAIQDAINTPVEAISKEIEMCHRYQQVTFRGRNLEEIILTGCEASPWLAQYFSNRLGIKCQFGNPFHNLLCWPNCRAALENPGRWTTALGLALYSP